MFEDANSMMNSEADLKSDRLNDDVALFMGCTLNETMGVVFISLALALMIAIPPIGLLLGRFTMGLAGALILLPPLFFTLLIKLSHLKRGKPAGYYQQYIKIRLSGIKLIKNPYVMRSGPWSTQRRFK